MNKPAASPLTGCGAARSLVSRASVEDADHATDLPGGKPRPCCPRSHGGPIASTPRSKSRVRSRLQSSSANIPEADPIAVTRPLRLRPPVVRWSCPPHRGQGRSNLTPLQIGGAPTVGHKPIYCSWPPDPRSRGQFKQQAHCSPYCSLVHSACIALTPVCTLPHPEPTRGLAPCTNSTSLMNFALLARPSCFALRTSSRGGRLHRAAMDAAADTPALHPDRAPQAILVNTGQFVG